MITYSHLIFLFLLLLSEKSVSQIDPCDLDKKEIPKNSTLSCHQGVFLLADNNDQIEDYNINKGYKRINIVLELSKSGESVYHWDISYFGFGEFDENNEFGNTIVNEGFNICDFKPDGPHIIVTDETSINKDKTLKGYEILTDYYCEGDQIEFYRMRFHHLERLEFLPFRVYKAIKLKSNLDNRDYINEFNILDNLKRAKITSSKSYFHNDQDASTIRKGFVVNGDTVIIDIINTDWIKVAYEGKTVTTEGWLKHSDVKILP